MPKSNRRAARTIHYDESLSAFVAVLRKHLPDATIEAGWILRNSSGKLSFITSAPIEETVRKKVINGLEKSASPYSETGDFAVLSSGDPGISNLLAQSPIFEESIGKEARGAIKVRVIDSRIVGQDWLTTPAESWQPPGPARLVFSSLKGGVGRSTALAVLAVHLAGEGKKVLVIDLDLEAPGIGTMLIDPRKKPKYGVLDWYVEKTTSDVSNQNLLLDMIAPCPFSGGTGIINVAPAVGRSSDEHPQNVLGKLSRAYLELPQETDRPISFLVQTQTLINQLSGLLNYDIVLVDARAGLNETTAAAMLGLGADVLLFGVDTPQTFASYRYLLAHLARFSRVSDDWLYRFRMVHAHASLDAKRQAEFRDRAYALFSEFFYDEVPLLDEGGNPLMDDEGQALMIEKFSVDDPVAPHYAWPILWDPLFSEFDPFSKQNAITKEFYMRSYSALIRGTAELMAIRDLV